MKKLIAPALVAVCMAGVALPAAAQPYGAPRPAAPVPPGGGRGLQLAQRADQLEQRIRRGVADGSLDRREADRAQAELAAVRRLQADLLARGRGALSQADRQQISARLDQLERSIRWLRTNDRVGANRDDRGASDFRYGYGRDFWNGAPQTLEQRVDWLETRVRRGTESGALTRGEADRAFAMLRDFRRMRADLLAQRGGRLTRRDQDRLSDRLNAISQQIRWLQTNNRRD
ncbi:MAG TPA: hypothetical protein VL358_00850 [Caulobacteraceae bacterium]|jgi:hypothetical protein|nr:hypothetical protein [Caulobacteraceae bacterium]